MKKQAPHPRRPSELVKEKAHNFFIKSRLAYNQVEQHLLAAQIAGNQAAIMALTQRKGYYWRLIVRSQRLARGQNTRAWTRRHARLDYERRLDDKAYGAAEYENFKALPPAQDPKPNELSF